LDDTPELKMVPLLVQGKDFAGELRCNMAAGHSSSISATLYALSAIGNQSTIKFLHAALKVPGADVTLRMPGLYSNLLSFNQPCRCAVTNLALDTWQIVALSEHKSFLLDTSDASLWEHLRSDKYTTPLLREWVPALKQELMSKAAIVPCNIKLNSAAAMVWLTSVALDTFVSTGIRAGALQFPISQ